MRVGWGFDAHRFGGPGPLKLAGVVVERERGLEGTSDADVALHALTDALLGAAALGDLGAHFPSHDPRWRGADSIEMLGAVVEELGSRDLRVGSVDLTIVSQTIRVAPHREVMREVLAAALGVEVGAVSVKGTTTDGMGSIGADQGVAAVAVAVVVGRSDGSQ